MRAPKDPKASADRDGRYEALRLSRWADVLEGMPPGANLNWRPLDAYMLPIWPAERREIAKHLRRLASNPHALQVMLDAAKSPARRGPKGNAKRAWLAALEFDLRRHEGKFDSVAAAVAKAWNMSRASLTAGWAGFVTRTAETQGLGGWRYWAVYELRQFRASNRGMAPRERRAAFIQYLHSNI